MCDSYPPSSRLDFVLDAQPGNFACYHVARNGCRMGNAYRCFGSKAAVPASCHERALQPVGLMSEIRPKRSFVDCATELYEQEREESDGPSQDGCQAMVQLGIRCPLIPFYLWPLVHRSENRSHIVDATNSGSVTRIRQIFRGQPLKIKFRVVIRVIPKI